MVEPLGGVGIAGGLILGEEVDAVRESFVARVACAEGKVA